MAIWRAILGGGLFMVLALTLATGFRFAAVRGALEYGVTFSSDYTAHLGLNAHEAYSAVLDDLGVRLLRLPVRWDMIEAIRHEPDYHELDWFMDQAAERQAKVILAIGAKVPRWPECRIPDWAEGLPEVEYRAALNEHVVRIVERYRDHPALDRWQIENEALFAFGEGCRPADPAGLQAEVALTRENDPTHPVQLTVSGEQQVWGSAAKEADIVGASLYRTVVDERFGYFMHPLPARWYATQTLSIAWFVDGVVISELQAEPWLTSEPRSYPINEAAILFTANDLEQNVAYARRTGLREISFWGVEWWYYLKQNGYPELWEAGRELIAESRSQP